jgi:hypothetical protein
VITAPRSVFFGRATSCHATCGAQVHIDEQPVDALGQLLSAQRADHLS